MANHCYLTSKNLPSDLEVLAKDVEEYMAFFDIFHVVKHDNYFRISHDDYDCVSFWVEEATSPRSKPGWVALNFRHGHSNPMYWWFEYELLARLTSKYRCLAYDEGIGNYKQSTKLYPSYDQYLLSQNHRQGYYLGKLDYIRLLLENPLHHCLKPFVGRDTLPKMDIRSAVREGETYEIHYEWVSI